MKKQPFTIPVWALSYLANRDKSGLNLEELRMCQTFERQNRIDAFLTDEGPENIGTLGAPWHISTNYTQAVFSVRYTSDELFNRIVCRVNGKYGAPMGRHSSQYLPDNWENCPHFDRRVPLDSGAYDKGGAYWGFPGNIRVKMSKDGQMWEFYRSWSRIDDSLKLHP